MGISRSKEVRRHGQRLRHRGFHPDRHLVCSTASVSPTLPPLLSAPGPKKYMYTQNGFTRLTRRRAPNYKGEAVPQTACRKSKGVRKAPGASLESVFGFSLRRAVLASPNALRQATSNMGAWHKKQGTTTKLQHHPLSGQPVWP